jgi:hypothetical protein
MLVPFRFAIGMQERGWWVRSDIKWCKTSAMPESVTDRPTSASEHIFLFTKNSRYFYDSVAVRSVASRGDNPHAVDKPLAVKRAASPRGLAAERRHVASNHEFAPYLALGALLGAKRVFGEEWHHDFREFLDVLKAPNNGGTGSGVSEDATDVLVDIAKYLGVIISESNLEAKPELIPNGIAAFAGAMPDNEAPLTIEQTREVVAKVVANAQAIRQTIPLDALAERVVNIDAIHQAVPLLDCSDALPGGAGNRRVAQAFLKHAALSFGKRRSVQLLSVDGHDITPLSSSIPPDTANMRDYWILGPEPLNESHYAAFPSAIPRRCILAGTSEQGACAACGAPWVRVVERTGGTWTERKEKGAPIRYGVNGVKGTPGGGPELNLGSSTCETTGWQPSCQCDASLVPCTVLDPFGGSGRTAVVARQLGRRCILIEVQASYVRMMRRQLAQQALPMMG